MICWLFLNCYLFEKILKFYFFNINKLKQFKNIKKINLNKKHIKTHPQPTTRFIINSIPRHLDLSGDLFFCKLMDSHAS
jgi:hypothetical protein